MDDDDDISSFSIRSGLSRSVSSLEESPQGCESDPYSALWDLATGGAMADEPETQMLFEYPPLDDTLLPGLGDSQGESLAPLESPKGSGEDDCEIVESRADAAVAAKKASAEGTASQESQHLLALLAMVKNKINLQKPLVMIRSNMFAF